MRIASRLNRLHDKSVYVGRIRKFHQLKLNLKIIDKSFKNTNFLVIKYYSIQLKGNHGNHGIYGEYKSTPLL